MSRIGALRLKERFQRSRVLTWSDDGTARLWAIGAESKEPLQSFEHGAPVKGAVFSKDESPKGGLL